MTSFPAFTSSEEQQVTQVSLPTWKPHLLPVSSIIPRFLADPHLNMGTLEIQDTRGRAELWDHQP